MAEQSEQISFRIPKEIAQRLDQARGKESRGTYAREMLIAGFDDTSMSELREEVERLRVAVAELEERCRTDIRSVDETVSQLRADLATAVVAILVTQGDSVPQGKAQSWAEKNLLQRRVRQVQASGE